jgi:hypothetical protein
MSNQSENTKKIIDYLSEKYEKDELNDESLVKIIELCEDYLNLQTLTNYAKSEGISYNGAKKRNLDIVTIDGVKFIINND